MFSGYPQSREQPHFSSKNKCSYDGWSPPRLGSWQGGEGCACPLLVPLSVPAQLGPRGMGCLGRGRPDHSGSSRCRISAAPSRASFVGLSEMLLWQLATHVHDPRDVPVTVPSVPGVVSPWAPWASSTD